MGGMWHSVTMDGVVLRDGMGGLPLVTRQQKARLDGGRRAVMPGYLP